MYRLTEKAQKAMERRFEIENRLLEIMNLVVAEWDSDPQSVACFDLRIVSEAKNLNKELKALPAGFGA